MGWNTQRVHFNVKEVHLQFIHGSVSYGGQGDSMDITFVYGLHSISDRKELWNGLLRWGGLRGSPWLILGDFNSIFSCEHRVRGNPISPC